ncbi:carbohydrate kinase family protein [Bacillus sp. 03113]|uniref:carbohydrate kinase family protein n=1 Tax=Bacillus sp. 03113 TaxID=2578211 RepID=UPI001143D1B7|nr:carbohydrate kinase [Bacillus sp. 03113]
MKKQGILSFGDAFVDYIATDLSNKSFETYLGGTTINVATGVARLGIPTSYICKLGMDKVSHFVEEELTKEKVDIHYSVKTPTKKICGVYVHLNEEGDRYFHSYMNETPDEVLKVEDLNPAPFEQAKIFYFGSGTLFHEQARKATEKALELAKKYQTLISFDSNIRMKRWKSEEECRQTILPFLDKIDILKISEDELFFLTETKSLVAAFKELEIYQIPYVFITLGEKGTYTVSSNGKAIEPAQKIEALDTTGAGDAFMSGILACFHEKGAPTSLADLKKYAKIGNAMGTWVSTQMGALPPLPSNKDFYEKIVKNYFS